MKRVIEAPETNVALFAFLLNLPWELAQVPLYAGMPTARHWTAVLACSRATLGDVVIALAAFWMVAVVVGARNWVPAPTRGRVAGFVVAGVVITIVMERLATGPLGRWPTQSGCPLFLSLMSASRRFCSGSSCRCLSCGSCVASSRERDPPIAQGGSGGMDPGW